MPHLQKILLLFLLIPIITQCQAQESKGDPRDTENWSIEPRIMNPVTIQWPMPSDAIVLLNDKVNQFVKMDGKPIEWTIDKGIMTVKSGSGNIKTSMGFGDCHLHVEWRSPTVVKGTGQGRGNSGIFLQSRYEIQVLDSYENQTYFNGQAGSVYKQSPPLANACAKVGDWNTYDIIYKAPKFSLDGGLLAYGSVTVIHNGIVIQNNTEIAGTSEYIGPPQIQAHMGAPIMLQDHGDLVSFRNIWIRRI